MAPWGPSKRLDGHLKTELNRSALYRRLVISWLFPYIWFFNTQMINLYVRQKCQITAEDSLWEGSAYMMDNVTRYKTIEMEVRVSL